MFFADHLAFFLTENRILMTNYYFSRRDSHAMAITIYYDLFLL